MGYLDIQALGRLAKTLRLQANLSQAEVALLIGTSQPNISAAEKGKETRYISVAINIIEQLSSCQVEGPYYRIIEQTIGEQENERIINDGY